MDSTQFSRNTVALGFSVLALAGLAACSSVPPTSIPQLWQSDLKAVQSLAATAPEGSFLHNLFLEIADSMRKSGRSFYDSLAEYEKSFPPEVLSFFLDASKTGQIDAYMFQAKEYCVEHLSAVRDAAKVWTPAITRIIMLMTFGMVVADLFVDIAMVSMRPITG